MNHFTKFQFYSKNLLPVNCAKPVNFVAYLKQYALPPNFKDVEFPEKNKLRFLEKVPQYPSTMRPPKCGKRLIDIRGPELIHNRLLHEQYGVMALTGGNLRHGHLEMIRFCVNRRMDARRMFAIWRVDPPWKPITKKSQGKRMGGGKGAINHYVTPVKAGRIIFEMGGNVEFHQLRYILDEVVGKMPFKSIAVSQEILDAMKKDEERQREENINPYSYKYIVENNMLGCHQWISPYDLIWHGKYR